jgi:L-aspartate oxidase
MKTHKSEYLIVGSGLAGLAFALKVADRGGSVILISKSELNQTNSAMAQGGISAVMSEDDSFESHIQDTLTAGAGLCRPDVVREYVTQAPQRIQDLINWGVHFDGDRIGDEFQADLTREGGHSFRRILHYQDQTGLEIHRRLLHLVNNHPKIKVFEKYFAIDLIINKQVKPYKMGPNKCTGLYALNKSSAHFSVEAFLSPTTVLATGGAGKVYRYTSNWSGATGDGIAMAYRAGVRIANMEFMQFHPTCLYHPEARNFLISEALRGEGGELINIKGEAFMAKYHPLKSLAPRDIVSRSIDAEIKLSGAECVYLDMRKHPKEFLQNRFPAIYAQCLMYGIEMSTMPIPVVPAAHYLCGGILTDSAGQTDLIGLFALGETACTGLHGANRLASNSLLECLTTAHNASEFLENHPAPLSSDFDYEAPEWVDPPLQAHEDELVVITHMWEEIRSLMWNYVGVVRSNKRLERANHRLQNILSEVKEYYSQFKISSDVIELRNIATVAELSVRCARKRKESRGIHYNIDFPAQDNKNKVRDTMVVRGL